MKRIVFPITPRMAFYRLERAMRKYASPMSHDGLMIELASITHELERYKDFTVSVTPKSKHKPFVNRCGDCGRRNVPMVILKDRIWRTIAKKSEHLCPQCMEKRLGRELTFADLKPCGITQELLIGAKLAARTADALVKKGYCNAGRLKQKAC